MKLTFFDVEYANSKNKSICQIGLVCCDSNDKTEILPSLDIYINPEDGFDERCVRVHGITPKAVEDKPTFSMIWEEIKPYFTDTIVIGHNVASADLDALVKTLIRYEIDVPQLHYICTFNLARRLISRDEVEDYTLLTLCNRFGIKLEDEHNAMADAYACMMLFYALIDRYNVCLEEDVTLYCGACISNVGNDRKTFSTYVCDRVVRRKVADFYGIVKGISLDRLITSGEEQCLIQWRNENLQYSDNNEITEIIAALDEILKKKKISKLEVRRFERVVEPFLSVATTACETLAVQILNGILSGIIGDGEVSQKECQNLYKWIYEHSTFIERYPFGDVFKVLEPVIKKEVYTEVDSAKLLETFTQILNPVQARFKKEEESLDVTNKIVCLSGNFSYGKKAEVTKLIQSRGGIVEDSVKKHTNILVIGTNESQSYAHGNYGTKVRKAMEYNKSESHIKIMKEADFFPRLIGG